MDSWRCVWILCLTCLCQLNAVGQVILQGVVVDDDTGDPLVSATVQVQGSGVYTNMQGRFDMRVDAGSMLVVARYLGYELYSDTVVADSDTTDIVIRLIPESNLLSEVTVSAGKYEQTLGEATVSIETLRPALIAQSNTTSIDDVLDKVPGVAIIDGQANIRGGSGFSYGAGSRVLVLVDDIPAYQADAGLPNWDDFPVENLAQVEVVKGAASVLHGSAALNGTINLRTAYAREAPETKAFAFYRAYMAPEDRSRQWWDKTPFEVGMGISDARRIGKLDLVNSAYYLDRDSYERDNFNRYGRFTTKLRYKPNSQMELGLGGNFNRGKNNSFFFWQNHEEGAYQGDTSNYSTGDYFRWAIDPYVKVVNERGDRHELKGRVFDVDNRNNANRSNRSTLYFGEYQYLRRLLNIDALITVGLVGIHTNVNAELYGDTTFRSDNLAAYLQVEKKFWQKLTINGGIRYEKNVIQGPTIVDGQQIPEGKTRESKPVVRLGMNYALGRATFVRGSWGQGYRFPTLAEKFISTTFGGTLISPNLSLQSETGWSAEIGIKQGWQLGQFQGIADVAWYWSEYFNMMEFVFTGLVDGFQSQNVGDTRIRGVDLSISGQGEVAHIPLTLLAGYTYIDPRFQEFSSLDSLSSSVDYNILKYRSKHLLKLDAQADISKFSIGLSLQYTSNMEAIDAIFEIFIPGLKPFRDNHKDYTTTDLRVQYRLSDKLTVTLLGRNVLNEVYSVRPGLLAAPRNLALRLDATL